MMEMSWKDLRATAALQPEPLVSVNYCDVGLKETQSVTDMSLTLIDF